MATEDQYLSTKAYSEKTGIPVSEVTRRLREGELNGFKKSGRWMIPANALNGARATESATAQPTDAAPPPEKRSAVAHADTDFSVSQFADMTYLTETGVRQWLSSGRLKGQKDGSGHWRVDAVNLENPDIRRLMR